MAHILLKDVRKTYSGGVEAVKGVSLDIADGEFVVLVGPSGCGKSTLLRMVAGLESITSGEVSIGGRRVNELEPASRDIAMVFQNYALYPHMSVAENLSYGLKNRRVPGREIEKRVSEAAAILGLSDMLSRKPSQLSGGQRQRVAMGRAIVREPAAFLFDEPLSNLDAKLRVSMRGEVKSLQRRLRTTSLYVTHDQLEAMTLADRLVVLNGGRIEQVGTPIELYERPETSFVATFIGSPAMNLLPLDAGTRESFVALPDGPWTESSFLGVRPEHMVIAAGEEALEPGSAAVRLRVESVELVGAESYVHGRLAARGEPADAPLPVTGTGPLVAVRVPGHARFEPGERIVASALPTALHRFDAGTGHRLPTF